MITTSTTLHLNSAEMSKILADACAQKLYIKSGVSYEYTTKLLVTEGEFSANVTIKPKE